MQTEHVDELHEELIKEQKRLLDLLAKTKLHIHKDEPISADFAEQAVDVENDEVVQALDQGAQIELSQVNKALQRIEEGSYGECVVCGESINRKRLQAIPHTPFCIDCASAK
ncbi:TraR/DksA family transcriptional regulator [Marinicella sp. S1101]|uniref:TraR/DksA family transcriptional regulator n=1 Tax=Marinicella marina TaxID=2996016 RepID=UPI0022608EB3|nr:TraR/DksA family transcriptional regulator [Marinicella marina]MCX7554225.1 TraR/DksA family transcriptional regulator [Marinicella marina]MDJ1138782.1 TraR/DksA family transcriptional regulator [Marinicella marina]